MLISRFSLLLTAVLFLAGCVSRPQYDEEQYRTDTAPVLVANNVEQFQGTDVMWGGIIIANNGTDAGSQLEVLAYPLKSNQRPDTSKGPLGRFLVFEDRFLEPLDFAEGRLVTVTGAFSETRDGAVGNADYVFPVVDAEAVYLWAPGENSPQVNFGVGVAFGF